MRVFVKIFIILSPFFLTKAAKARYRIELYKTPGYNTLTGKFAGWKNEINKIIDNTVRKLDIEKKDMGDYHGDVNRFLDAKVISVASTHDAVIDILFEKVTYHFNGDLICIRCYFFNPTSKSLIYIYDITDPINNELPEIIAWGKDQNILMHKLIFCLPNTNSDIQLSQLFDNMNRDNKIKRIFYLEQTSQEDQLYFKNEYLVNDQGKTVTSYGYRIYFFKKENNSLNISNILNDDNTRKFDLSNIEKVKSKVVAFLIQN